MSEGAVPEGTEGAASDREAWNAWRRSVFGDPYLVWHDGPDFGELLRLAAEPGNAAADIQRMLALGLRERDALAAKSIGQLLENDLLAAADARRLLSEVLPSAEADPGSFLVAVASVLRVATGEEGWSSLILRVLFQAPDWSSRIDAALALRSVEPTPEVVEALTRAMADPEYLVRYHAAETMLRHAYRTVHDITLRPEIFARICVETEDGPGEWREAARLLAGECVPRIERRRA